MPDKGTDLVGFDQPRPTAPTGRPHPCPICRLGTLRLQYTRMGRTRKLIYACDHTDCDAMITAHQQPPYHPLGTPADAATRKLRIEVHKAIDPLWMAGDTTRRKHRRTNLYRWLAYKLNIPHYHTADLDAAGCKATIELVQGLSHKDFEAPPPITTPDPMPRFLRPTTRHKIFK